MASTQISIKTSQHTCLVPITREVQAAVVKLGLQDGLVHLMVLHTTCALTINENADPDVCHDILLRLEDLAPWKHPKDLHGEGNSAAHLKSSLLGVDLTLPVQDGRLVLGTWQGIYLAEFDGPRTRKIHLTHV